MNFAAQLRQWRIFKGFTQVELAQGAGIPRPNLIDLETGRRDCTLKTLGRLAKALDIRPGVLLDESPQKKVSLNRHEVDQVARALLGGKSLSSKKLEKIKTLLLPVVFPTLRAVGLLSEGSAGPSTSRSRSIRKMAEDFLGVEGLERLVRRINKLAANQVS